jgi:hypothetical protein
MLALLTCQIKLTCKRDICTNKSATIDGNVTDSLIHSIPFSKTIYFVIYFNAAFSIETDHHQGVSTEH